MVSVDQEENGDTAADALASLRRATKELKEAADIFENNFQDEPATGRTFKIPLSGPKLKFAEHSLAGPMQVWADLV